MTIKIPVEASLGNSGLAQDIAKVEQRLNALAQAAGRVSKIKIEPITPKSKADLDALTKNSSQLLKVHTELARRMSATGQKGVNILDANFESMYPNPRTRARKIQEVMQYVGAAHPTARPPAQAGGIGVGGMVAGAAQAGLRAANGPTGGTGGVAANAIGTGMSAGAGAGLMGLMGGMLALGVSKIVGSVVENIDKAEKNDVAYDRLKRQLGDVNVAFDALKVSLQAGASNVNITFEEAEKLGSQFAKLGNVTADRFSTLRTEVETGVGFSRAFGVDNEQGTGILGRMRGVGATTDENGTRRMALLIGETIGKSDAFAKSGEVMEALANYTTQQTRASMSAANTSGYAGMFSAMVGAKIPGMDVEGSANILSRLNSVLSAGGAKGEASQFATGVIGKRLGLDPLQTQIFRENGAFATKSRAFGDGSAYKDYMGHSGPAGDKTYLAATREYIESQYSGNSDEQKMLRANAFANHTGLNMNQAMRVLKIKPNEMGEMEKYVGDITKLSASGIGNMAKVVSGTDSERRSVADSLLGRSDVSQDDKDKITSVMTQSVEEQKKTLAEITSRYEQERTQGSDIRDSKNALDNIKTILADKLVPLTLQMRMGIVHIAGAGKRTTDEIMGDIMDLESAKKKASITGEYDPQILAAEIKKGKLRSQISNVSHGTGLSPEEKAAKLKELQSQYDENESSIAALKARKKSLLEAEDARYNQTKRDMKTSRAAEESASARLGSKKGLAGDQDFKSKVSEAERADGAPAGLYWALMQQESGDGIDQYAISSTGAEGAAQILPSTRKLFEKRAGRKLNSFDPEDALYVLRQHLGDDFKATGDWDKALHRYNSGPNENHPGRDPNFVKNVRSKMKRNEAQGTALPNPQSSRGGDDTRIKFDDININIRNEKGQMIGQPQRLAGRVQGGGKAAAFGTERYA